MKNIITLLFIAAALTLSCDLIDGTNVRNPDLTLDEAVSQDNAPGAVLNGLKRRTATIYNSIVVLAELTTDNYVNKATFYNQNVDNGNFRDTDTDYNTAARNIAQLREQAIFGLTTILDDNPDERGTELEAELYFYKGWSHLLAGELFTALPAEPGEAAVSPADHFQLAADAFEKANTIHASTSYDLALARTYYNLGDKTKAVDYANDVLAADDEFVRFVEFDGVQGPSNTMQSAVYTRQSFNDLQPLPRLDFLDPKYGGQSGTDQTPIPMQKAEEAYLIIAEAELKDSQLGAAQTALKDLITLVASRPTDTIDDTEEGRKGTAGDIVRPDESGFKVRASASRPFISGLVLDRTATLVTPRVSGTSLTAADIDALTDNAEALRTLYLMRQEVFFGEARRITDLGVRWPVSEIEALNNDKITAADRKAVVPSYLPSNYGDLDAFDMDRDALEVTILIDVNEILAAQKGNKFD